MRRTKKATERCGKIAVSAVHWLEMAVWFPSTLEPGVPQDTTNPQRFGNRVETHPSVRNDVGVSVVSNGIILV